jgi:hypothetical protein
VPYIGYIIYDEQPLSWINRHKSFASRIWLENQIRFGQWEETSGENFIMIITEWEGAKKNLKIEIRASYHQTGTIENPFRHVLVEHTHVLRSK